MDIGLSVKFIGENAEYVTGSSTLVEYKNTTILLEYGMMQGKGNVKDFIINSRLNNQLSPSKIDYLLLTHSHIDHSGLIPSLYKYGFDGKIITPPNTKNILRYLWNDCSYLSSKTAQYLNKRDGTDRHIAYFNKKDINKAIENIIELEFYEDYYLTDDIHMCYTKAGHILNSGIINLNFKHNGFEKRLIYTGDLGSGIIPYYFSDERDEIPNSDIVIAESTYSGKDYDLNSEKIKSDRDEIRLIIRKTMAESGKILFPTFSLHRSPEVLYLIYDLFGDKLEANVYLDSPLAYNLFREYSKILDNDKIHELQEWENLKIVNSSDMSKAINNRDESCIIVSSSGMFTEYTRSAFHLASIVDNPKNVVIKTGYAAENTLGFEILDNDKVYIHGENYEVNCKVYDYKSFSSHIQYQEMIDVYGKIIANEGIYLVHGNKKQKDKFAEALHKEIEYNYNSTKVYSVQRGDTINI